MTEFHSLECSYQTSVMILNKNLVPKKYYSEEREKNPKQSTREKNLYHDKNLQYITTNHIRAQVTNTPNPSPGKKNKL